jgi:MFS family permease
MVPGMDGSAALSEPAVPVGHAFMALYALANLGLWMALFVPIQVLLAQQVALLAPVGKEAAFGWVTGAGALVAMFANPLAGALSDRSARRHGRHRWTLGGAALGALALVMLGRQQSLLGVAAWWCAAQAALNAMLAALSAELPDRVPVAQRARCSAWIAASQPLGVVLGTVLATEAGAGYGMLALLLPLLALPYAVAVHRVPVVPAAASAPGLPRFAAAPWRHADFVWAWATRFLFNLGNALATLYLLYFVRDAIGYERLFPGRSAEDGLLVLVLLYTAGVLAGAFAGGAVSDRSGRRKPPVIAAGLVLAAASALIAAWPTWPAAQLASLLTGAGFGIYLAVDQALASQVLPSAAGRARDLGVLNAAIAAPQVLAPALAALLVTGAGGYPALYAVSAVVTLAGALLVRRIRGVA